MKLINPKEQIQLGRITTSRTELLGLIKAWIAISFAFAIILGTSIFSLDFMVIFMIASLTVGLGFIAHEMAHKVVAQHYGCQAEFRSWDSMLLLAIFMAFLFKAIFVAPGAVFITGPVGKRRNGIISAAGAIANLIIAALFLLILLSSSLSMFSSIAGYGFMINTWLALFNMLPFWMFDGKKILNWNKWVYFTMVAICVAFILLQKIMIR